MFIVEAKSPPLPRLQRLVDLQSRLRRSGMQDIEKRNLSEAVDRLAMKIVKKTGFIEAMAPRDLPPPARMVALLQIFGEKAVTEGSFANAVRAELSPHLKIDSLGCIECVSRGGCHLTSFAPYRCLAMLLKIWSIWSVDASGEI